MPLVEKRMLFDETGKMVSSKVISDSEKKIIFFGASVWNIDIIEQWNLKDRVLFFVDSDTSKVGSYLNGYEIHAREELADYKDTCCVLSALIDYADEVLPALLSYGIEHCIFCVSEKFDISLVRRDNIKVLEKKVMYKYIHIFPSEKFTQPFYRMLEDNFDIREHLFIIDYRPKTESYGELQFAHEKVKQNSNVLIIDDVHKVSDWIPKELQCNTSLSREKLAVLFDAAEQIILHSVYRGKRGKVLHDGLTDKVPQKLTWICWGGDDVLGYEIIKKVRYAYASKARIPYINQKYGIQVQETLVSYAYATPRQVKKIMGDKGKEIHILLGHYAWPQDNHLYGFKLLQKYQNENIKIYCPLSYGVEKYREQVIESGREIFGDKFIPMTDFLKSDSYSDFLDSIDIAVMPMTHMAAGTTLMYLNAIGKKIYMSKERISNFQPAGICAEDMESIRWQSFDEFIAYSDREGEGLKKMNEKIVFEWGKILNT